MTFQDRRPEIRQERDAVPLKGIFLIALATALMGTALSLWAAQVVVDGEQRLRPSGHFPERRWVMPEDVYGVHQGLFDDVPNAERYNRTPRRELTSFGWIDKERRLVRVPIERAMELRAAGGKP